MNFEMLCVGEALGDQQQRSCPDHTHLPNFEMSVRSSIIFIWSSASHAVMVLLVTQVYNKELYVSLSRES